mgnify:CR=1 FL=1
MVIEDQEIKEHPSFEEVKTEQQTKEESLDLFQEPAPKLIEEEVKLDLKPLTI